LPPTSSRQRGRLLSDLGHPAATTLALMVLAWSRSDRLSTIGLILVGGVGVGGAWPGRVTASDGATGQAVLSDIGFSAAPMLARILAWALDATDFRSSQRGVGGACPWRRTVCEARESDGTSRKTGQAACRPWTVIPPTPQNRLFGCTHRMQLSSPHLHDQWALKRSEI
jgi:hypothetical protein